ncbi:MAG: lytic murein transglycosylase, partial [Plesiomonas sp.]
MKRSLLSLIGISILLTGCASSEATHVIQTQQSTQAEALATFRADRTPADFAEFIQHLKQHALAQGIAPATVEQGFANVYFLERAVKADKGQPEFKLTLDQYLKKS